jgi:uncharacterized protein with beta-barrel porin domain
MKSRKVQVSSGAESVTVNGDVTGTTGSGIYANSSNATNQITVQNGGAVSGNIGILAQATTQLDVTLNGTVSPVTVAGTSGTAIQLGNQNDTLALSGAVAFHGDVLGGGGTDTLTLGTGTITLPDAGHKTISGFETINITGRSIVNGNLDATGDALTITGAGNSLHLNGLLTANSLTVSNGGEFGGNNTFTGNLIMGSGGQLAPGNSIGTINITGNLTFNTGAVFKVEVNGTSSDVVNATGNITIQPGVTLNVVPLGSFSGSSTPFLNAGGTLTGTFDTVTLNGVATTIVYGASGASFGAGGSVLLAASPSTLNAQALSLQDASLLFSDAVADTSAQAALTTGKYLWARALYTNNSRDANGNYNGFNDNMGGIVAGGEGNAAEHWKLGFALAQIENNTDVQSSADATRGHNSFASVYTTYTQPVGTAELLATLGATGGYSAIDNKREVSNSGVAATAKSDNNATSAGLFTRLGVRSKLENGWSLLPALGASYTHISTGGFTEQGGGLAGISMEGYSFGTWETSESITLAHEAGLKIHDMAVTPRFTVGLTQRYAGSGGQAQGNFSNGTPLTLAFDRSNTNFVTAGAGLDLTISPEVTGFVEYQNQSARNQTNNAAKAGVNIRF